MRFALALSLSSMCLLGIAHAQDQPYLDLEAGLSDTSIAQELANPVANLTSVPFQNNFDFGGGRGNAFRYTLNIQPIIPFTLNDDWNLITRTIIPFAHVERVFPQPETGVGDIVQSFFLSPTRPVNGITWGAGPVFLYPSASNDFIGAGQWGAGPTGVVLKQSGPWLYGILANHLWTVGGVPDLPSGAPLLLEVPNSGIADPGFVESNPGSRRRERVNATFIQPFLTYTFPMQTTPYLTTETVYDWTARQSIVPINVGVNQLVSIGGQILQVGGLVRYYAETPRGGPNWGFQLRISLVFPRGS